MQYLASFKDKQTGMRLEQVDVPMVIGKCNQLYQEMMVGFEEVEMAFRRYYDKSWLK